MIERTKKRLDNIAERNQGVITMQAATKAGISPGTIYNLRNNGELICISRGVYLLADASDKSSVSPEYLAIRTRVPNAVLCTLSALYHYELTTEIPRAIHLGINRNSAIPEINYPVIEIYRIPEKMFSVGVQKLIVNGVEMNVFSPEKTLADCFKYRNRLGLDLAVEGLKRYLQRPDAKPSAILAMAKVNRVGVIIRPYLEALV